MKRLLNYLLFLTLLYCAVPSPVLGQNRPSNQRVTVSGTVVDDKGEPVIGAAVLVNNNPQLGGAITDQTGRFSIEAPVGSTLFFTSMGYQTQEAPVKDHGILFITMPEETTELDEVVVVGFGVQTKESLVGSISKVDSDDLVTSGSNSAITSMKGKVSGLQINSPSGVPGLGMERTRITIRGISHWTGATSESAVNDANDNAPLVMVDGIERSMEELDPNEIESISILKDASATAVFGSKGANGVILVTTKTGSVGKPRMRAKVEYGVRSVVDLPSHIDAATTLEAANVAYRNGSNFSSQFSSEIIEKYRSQSDPFRYPDVDWFEEIFEDFVPTYNANFDISGGTEKFKYFASGSYTYDSTPLKLISGYKQNTWASDRFNYRLNMDMNVTRSTVLSFKFGGAITMNKAPQASSNDGTIFATAYMASGLMYPGYFTEEALKQYPDPNFPDAAGVRLAQKVGTGSAANPMTNILNDNWSEDTKYTINSDIILKQNLDFITKGLTADMTVSLSTITTRASNASSGGVNYPQWRIDWTAYDAGESDIWINQTGGAQEVYTKPPISESASSSIKSNSLYYTFTLQGGLQYARKFGDHNVTGRLVYNQRQYNAGISAPRRNQSAVGRVTWDYKKKYLFEANFGVTGSEQFAPKYRYGLFPSAAVGYAISKEPFWRSAMPWWSTMKIRYSYGLTGYDTAASGYLYHTSYSKSGNYYVEGAAANTGARWETARKQDLGFEMGWLHDDLTLNVDLFDEYRYDMLIAPVVTPLLGASSKKTNSGSIKKHGIEIELNWHKSFRNGFFYDIGGSLSLNENRVVTYPDPPFEVTYKKVAGTPIESKMMGIERVDGGFFNNIDDVHGYPSIASAWKTLGMFKYLDYSTDGFIDGTNDTFVARGNMYAPGLYSANLSLGYKNLTFKVTGTGTIGQYSELNRSFIVPFYNSNLKLNEVEVDYWTPQHHNASVQNVVFDSNNATTTYMWTGNNWNYLGIPGVTWRNSDYFELSEIYLGYTLRGKKLKDALGINGVTVSLVGNHVYTFTKWPETSPQLYKTSTMYFPLMRTVKCGVSVSF